MCVVVALANWIRLITTMLFDRKTDPLEVKNLIHDPKSATIKMELVGVLEKWGWDTPQDAKQASAEDSVTRAQKRKHKK